MLQTQTEGLKGKLTNKKLEVGLRGIDLKAKRRRFYYQKNLRNESHKKQYSWKWRNMIQRDSKVQQLKVSIKEGSYAFCVIDIYKKSQLQFLLVENITMK